MALDFAHYEGREQAFVKHTFLDKYLPPLIAKVCARQYDEFVYIDGFSGPWKSVAGEAFGDTSFGIALSHMTALRIHYLRLGRDIKMRAFLVEKDPNSFAQLVQAIKLFPKVDVTPLNGTMEAHSATIARSMPSNAFSFTLIDPKGFPDIRAMMPLLTRQNAEALANFMFDFANRFAGTELIPALESWLSALESDNWREQVDGLSGIEREQKLETLAATALQVTGGYAYAPVISVDKVLYNRTLYKLIFLSRHSEGLKVFRDSEAKTLNAQAEVRSAAKAKKRAAVSDMQDLFAMGEDAIPNDKSLQIIKQSQEQAAEQLVHKLTTAGSTGVVWGDLWPPILEKHSVTRSWLGRKVNDFRKCNRVLIPQWPNEQKQIPEDSYRLTIAE